MDPLAVVHLPFPVVAQQPRFRIWAVIWVWYVLKDVSFRFLLLPAENTPLSDYYSSTTRLAWILQRPGHLPQSFDWGKLFRTIAGLSTAVVSFCLWEQKEQRGFKDNTWLGSVICGLQIIRAANEIRFQTLASCCNDQRSSCLHMVRAIETDGYVCSRETIQFSMTI